MLGLEPDRLIQGYTVPSTPVAWRVVRWAGGRHPEGAKQVSGFFFGIKKIMLDRVSRIWYFTAYPDIPTSE
jgi:hypothetical protein